MRTILSLDIGGTKLAASAITSDGTLLAKRRAPSPAEDGPSPLLELLLRMAREAVAEGGAPFDAIGISMGGPLDPVTGIVSNPPNLRGWGHIPLRRWIAEGMELPEARVFLENDANAGALAEQRFGAARGRRHALFLTMSTGIGGGMILDGKLYRGAGFNAGEVGHQVVLPDGPRCGCGGRGCLEAVASGSGIARRLRERWNDLPAALREAAGTSETISAGHLFEAVRSGDPWAATFLDETLDLLARGLANLTFILNPEIIILGTLAWHGGDLLIAPLKDRVRTLCWPALTTGLEIVATELGPRIEELSGLAVVLAADASVEAD